VKKLAISKFFVSIFYLPFKFWFVELLNERPPFVSSWAEKTPCVVFSESNFRACTKARGRKPQRDLRRDFIDPFVAYAPRFCSYTFAKLRLTCLQVFSAMTRWNETTIIPIYRSLSVGKTKIKSYLGSWSPNSRGSYWLVERRDKQLPLYPCDKSFCGGVGVAFFKKHPHKIKKPFWVVVPKWQRERLNGWAHRSKITFPPLR